MDLGLVFRRLLLGVSLIVGASAVLLLSDLSSRVGAPEGKSSSPRVALLQHASQPILEDGVRGILDGLSAAGFVTGQNLTVQRFNAEGDAATSNTIAREMANGGADLLITVSTPSLQAVANANRATRKHHVFASVTDPAATGVGISRTDPLSHPAWMAGFGTLQPVRQAFEMAKTLNPSLRRVGTLYNASEANSETQLVLARKACQDLGLELVETTVDNTSGVGEAAAALCARGVQAIFLPGDVTVLVAADTLLATAKKSGVPVFSVIPPNARKGAIFDLGANYYEVGVHAGKLAAEILNGRDPATVPVENFMPETLIINEQVLETYRDAGWSLPDEVRARANTILGKDGSESSKAPAAAKPSQRAKPWNLQVVCFSESPPVEETLAGLKKGMAAWPWKEGVDYTIRVRNAQGDMAALNGLVDAAAAEKPDVLIPLSTPALQIAAGKVRDRPVVFAMVANPMAAGVAKSYEDHPPHLTGVTVLAPAGDLLDLIQKHYPKIRRIGTIYCPAEANSVDLRDILLAEAAKRKMHVETVAVATPGELADAAMSLAGKRIDAIVQISDNLTSGGFTAISRAARQARKPLFSLNSTTIPLGAAVVMGRDYEAGGETAAALMRRVLEGESPAVIPIQPAPGISSAVSIPNARALGMEVPAGLLDDVKKVIHQ